MEVEEAALLVLLVAPAAAAGEPPRLQRAELATALSPRSHLLAVAALPLFVAATAPVAIASAMSRLCMWRPGSNCSVRGGGGARARVALLPGATGLDAIAIARRIRASMGGAGASGRGSTPPTRSSSSGVVARPESSEHARRYSL